MEEKSKESQSQQKRYKTHSERIGEIEESVENEKKEKLFRKIISLSDDELDFAEKTFSLLGDERFKEYLKLESAEISRNLVAVFEDPRNRVKGILPDTCSFGEVMAFNKGFHYGLMAIKGKRERIFGAYLKQKKRVTNENES